MPRFTFNTMILGLFGVTVIVIAGIFVLAGASRQNEALTNAAATQVSLDTLTVSLEMICSQKFYDGVLSRAYTESELKAGCHASIQNTLRVWPDQISYCAQNYKPFETRFAECLDAQSVVILRSYIIQARDHPELLQTPDQSPTLDWGVLTQFPGG